MPQMGPSTKGNTVSPEPEGHTEEVPRGAQAHPALGSAAQRNCRKEGRLQGDPVPPDSIPGRRDLLPV